MKIHLLVSGCLALFVCFALKPMLAPDKDGLIEIDGEKMHMLGHINLAMRDYWDKKQNVFIYTPIVRYSARKGVLSDVCLVRDITRHTREMEEIRANKYVYQQPTYVAEICCLIGGVIFVGIKKPSEKLNALVSKRMGELMQERRCPKI